jgi:hypothetical protein
VFARWRRQPVNLNSERDTAGTTTVFDVLASQPRGQQSTWRIPWPSRSRLLGIPAGVPGLTMRRNRAAAALPVRDGGDSLCSSAI